MQSTLFDTRTETAHIDEIKAAEKRLEAQLQAVLKQLDEINRMDLSDSQPYITFKPVNLDEFIRSLGQPMVPLRTALQQDINELRGQLRNLKAELQAAQRTSRLKELKSAERVTAEHYRDWRRKMHTLLESWAHSGERPDAELEKLLGAQGKILDEQIGDLRKDATDKNIRAVLESMTNLSLFGRDDGKGWSAVGDAVVRRTDESILRLRTHATRTSVRDVLNKGKEAALLGRDDASQRSINAAREGMKVIGDHLETQFRAVPTAENWTAMLKARYEQSFLSDSPTAPELPKGFKDAPHGTRHTLRHGETLSGLAKRYFGNAGFWDVLMWRNPGVIHNPDFPPVGKTIVIA